MNQNPYQTPVAAELPVPELICSLTPFRVRIATSIKSAFRWVTMLVLSTMLILVSIGILILLIGCWRAGDWTSWNRLVSDTKMPLHLGTLIIAPYLISLAFCMLLAVVVSTVEHFVQKAKWKRHLLSQISLDGADSD